MIGAQAVSVVIGLPHQGRGPPRVPGSRARLAPSKVALTLKVMNERMKVRVHVEGAILVQYGAGEGAHTNNTSAVVHLE